MPKSVLPGRIKIANDTFSTNAVPDPFDDRDLAYRPKLDPLPPLIDPPEPELRHVLKQTGDSCTGHALAATINASLAKRAKIDGIEPARVSPYMLYHFARRYDDFPGEADTGSSLRAALKGWFYHGVCTEDRWRTGAKTDVPDIHSRDFVLNCKERPLGAFYRVNCYRLDDMQSAISELHAVLASGRIGEGWHVPARRTKNGTILHIIKASRTPREPQGHAFAIVGYNEIGFIVQNSWGSAWGDGGFAVLAYEDWLDCAYDAWVVRHGVPNTPFLSGRRRDEVATHSVLATGVGPSHRRLDRHLLSLAGDGGFSSTGEFVSTPEQVDRIVSRMQDWHDAWDRRPKGRRPKGVAADVRRHVVLYVQSGLRPEHESLEAAERPLNWWLNNRIYPIYLAWDSGPAEALLEELGHRMSRKLPRHGIGFDLVEQFDRLVELTARRHRRWMWDQLKQHARAAGGGGGSKRTSAVLQLAGRLAAYVRRRRRQCAVHLVGHSAGALVLAELLPRLLRLRLPVTSLTLLAPAITTADFQRLLRRLPARPIPRFTLFGLSDERELNDTCASEGEVFYQKSLLYLIARGLEARDPGSAAAAEIPLLGMARYFMAPDLQGRIRDRFEDSTFITAPATANPKESTDAVHHGDFEDDAFTMTSIVARMLEPAAVDPFRAHAPLLGIKHVPGRRPRAAPAGRTADTQSPDNPPVSETAPASRGNPEVPACSGAKGTIPPELAEAPTDGDRTLASIELVGWKPVDGARPPSPTRRPTHAKNRRT